MRKFDLIILGGFGGPTAVSIAERYMRDGKNKCILITEADSKNQGAVLRGAKTATQIITKSPKLRNNIEKYKEIVGLVERSIVGLEHIYDGTTLSPYMGKSRIGVRQCRSIDELEMLLELGIGIDEPGIFNLLADFVKRTTREDTNLNNLFYYTERLWNISGFLKRFQSKINIDNVWNVQKVIFDGINSDDEVVLEIIGDDKSREKICAKKVFVCKGTGNIEFEINITEKDYPDLRNLEILQYYKSICKNNILMPEQISSVFLPAERVCLTNECESNYSLLFDINTNVLSVQEWLDKRKDNLLENNQKKLTIKYPHWPENISNHFMCAMPIDCRAYSTDHSKYFEFIITNSTINNIHYFNLTYFTTICSALDHLPSKLNDF